MLSARGIEKSFNNKQVLKSVDIDISPGQITCLIGPSGTGKTTLLRSLAFLDYPSKGSVAVDGKKYDFPLINGKDIETPWPHITTVFQSLFLWPHMTLRENIMLPARNCNENAEKDIKGLAKLFEMEDFIDKYPNQTSLGQRQRAAMVRALILNPRYILLDEITSALDVEQTARVLTKLNHLKECNIGVFLITHAIGFAKRAADNIVFMSDGEVVESGNAKILSNPQSERLKQFLSIVEMAQ